MIGPNSPPTRCVPCCWMANTPIRITTVIGTTYGSKSGVATFEPFDRAEHGDRRRDHAVAVEQRRAEHAEQHQHRAAAPAPSGRGGHQRGQREDAAFALVVGAHHDRDVLDRDDEQQRVDDERQHAEHVLVRRRHRVRAEEALAHRVERAGADVAVDDAEGGEDDCRATPVVRTVSQISSGFSYITRRRGPPAALQVWPQGPLARRHRIPRSVWRREILRKPGSPYTVARPRAAPIRLLRTVVNGQETTPRRLGLHVRRWPGTRRSAQDFLVR